MSDTINVSKLNCEPVKMIGARALIEALINEGVEVIFGYPGAATIPIHDVLMESNIRHILTRHEQGAVHAADGYARASGKVGVCLATSGPGALNLVTGIATAHMDSVPMVSITGQVATFKLGTDAFQEADMTGVSIPIAKHSILIENADDIAKCIHEAFYIASTGRPGPVVVDIPIDVSFAETLYIPQKDIDIRSYRPLPVSQPAKTERAAKYIGDSKRPMILAGGGVIISNASDALYQLAQKTQAPVAYTLMGKGAFPDGDRLNLGMIGMHGQPCANYAAKECDLLIAVGMRFSDRSTGKISAFAPDAVIIHIDIDPAEIRKLRRPDLSIVDDAKCILSNLESMCIETSRPDWLDRLDEFRENHQTRQNSDEGRISPDDILSVLNSITNGDCIITTDVGQHQMWASQMLDVKNARGFISSGGLGTMGFGLPSAMGAQVAFPEKNVFVIQGDGGFLMNSQELMTSVENHLPIKILLFNNGFLGMVRQWQQLFYNRRYASTDISAQPDFIALANAYGAAGIRVTKNEDIAGAIRKSLEITDRPCLIDFHIDREACVLPMIPTGGSVEDMILELD